VALTVFNSAFGVGLAEEQVRVVDTTPPTIQVVQPVTDTLCDPGSEMATIATPTATDVCSPTVTVTGAVVSINGVAPSAPIPIQNGGARLPPGVSVVEWTATDASGNVATTTQTLTVRLAIEASRWIALDEDASVVLPNGAGFAMIGDTGAGRVLLHTGAQSGSILSQGPVRLDDGAIVHGDVASALTVAENASAVVTGTVTENATVSLPAGRDLSGVVFPTTNSGPVNVAHLQTLALAPGAYSVASVLPSATLVLTAGTYLFEELDLHSGATLNLDQSGGPVSVFVHTTFLYQGQIAPIAGAPGGFVLGYAGDQPLLIGTRFLAGTLIAPNATVAISAREPDGFVGELFAKGIVVKQGSTLVCDPVGLSAQQAGLAAPRTTERTERLSSGGARLPTAPASPSSRCSLQDGAASARDPAAMFGGALVVLAAGWRARRRRVARPSARTT
jgi:hypothetical protein